MKKYFTENFHIKNIIRYCQFLQHINVNFFNFSLINFHFP